MGAKKIQDEKEVIRWFAAGWTYKEMSDEYERKYNIEMKPSAWGNFRYRKGLDRRIARDDELIPWAVKKEHRQLYPLAMLRVEGRKRAGLEVPQDKLRRLESWRQMLDEENAVVHYDPDTVDGFFYVPREESDNDIIREPEKKTTERRNAEKRSA
ncbi:hypothetical protein ACFU6R_03295 [Streptomyces sp. NPDC057499]|uniref:hypothetical protein n=1 Tax=Streptomyces sp. NPDC057499 TaxID=3346150 RepID=UPI0036C8B7C9